MTADYWASRREAMKALYRDGATLEEIGTLYGVTRERVRQVIAKQVTRGRGVDPIRVIQISRRAGSLSAAAKELGTNPRHVKECLLETGYWPAVDRLWRWRQSFFDHGKITDEQLLVRLRAKAAQLGHTPGMWEVNDDPDMPSHTTYVHRFGNWAPACIAAGLVPSKRGAGGHRRARWLLNHIPAPFDPKIIAAREVAYHAEN